MSSKLRCTLNTLIAGLVLFLANAISQAESVNELIEKGAVCDRKFEPNEALTWYLAAAKMEPQNPRILVPIARQYRYLMTDAPTIEEKLRWGHIAEDYSTRAAVAGPHDSEAQLATAITLGKMLPYLPKKEQVAASPLIKESVDKALVLNPRNDTAWHVLGRWNRVLADVNGLKRVLAAVFYGNLPKGSYEEAERDMKKALELNPHRLMHYIELGRIYAQMGRKADARLYINKGLAMPNAEKDDPETKRRGLEALAKL
jgi:tetratricopeptide (TPR) repeat protein